MKRRTFITSGALAGALTACGQNGQQNNQKGNTAAPAVNTGTSYRWKIVTSWPKNFPGLGTAVESLAKWINNLSNGQMQVKVYAAGGLVPAFGVFDAVSEGVAEMGHSGSYYWKGKNEAFQFFTSIPFGMNVLQMNAWLHEGGGLKLWEEAYAPFGLVPIPAGNTGIQMGGWFNREINNIEDFRGLKMRIPGLAGDVLRQVGVSPVTLPGAELLTAMQTGVLDAVEWATPYTDMSFGLHKVAKYYYYPGWQEPGPNLECMVNRKAYESLPPHLKEIVRAAALLSGQEMTCEFTAKNYQAIMALRNERKVDMRAFSPEILNRLHEISDEVNANVANTGELAKRIYQSYIKFHKETLEWLRISDKMYYSMQG